MTGSSFKVNNWWQHRRVDDGFRTKVIPEIIRQFCVPCLSSIVFCYQLSIRTLLVLQNSLQNKERESENTNFHLTLTTLGFTLGTLWLEIKRTTMCVHDWLHISRFPATTTTTDGRAARFPITRPGQSTKLPIYATRSILFSLIPGKTNRNTINKTLRNRKKRQELDTRDVSNICGCFPVQF